jgi:hypothetical protein
MIIACAAARSTDASDGRDRLSVEGHDAIFSQRVQYTGVRFNGCQRIAIVPERRLRLLPWRMNVGFMKNNLSSKRAAHWTGNVPKNDRRKRS